MRLYSFVIKNFKSIINTEECKISKIDNVVILAGQNESGKTAVLEALDFFANGPSDRFEKFQKRQGSSEPTEVHCRFLIGKSDFEYFDTEFSDDANVLEFLKKKKDVVLIRKCSNSEKTVIEIDQSFFDDFTVLNTETDEEEGEAVVTSTSPVVGPIKVVKSDEEMDAAKELKREELIKKINEKFNDTIPTFSLYSSFEDLLPSEIAVTKLEDSKAVKDFEKVFNVNLKELAEVDDPRKKKMEREKVQERATDNFNESWSQTISSLKDDKKYRFSIEINDAEPKKIIFMIEGEDKIPLYLEQKSMGFRWFSAFHLRLRALMKDSEDICTKDNDNNIIILIDEPGQNLHDIAQKDVKQILDQTADKNIQIIFSTHNPSLIGDINTSDVEFTRIRLVSNDKKLGTRVYNVPQFIAQKKGGSLDALSPIRAAMGLNSVGSIFDQNKLNVVVEGITDNYYLTALRELYNYDEKLSFIPVCGVDNVKSLTGLIIGWGMKYKAVFDDDPQQGRKAYNSLKKHYFENDDDVAHEHILKIKDCNGIEDIFSKADFRKFIYTRELTAAEKSKSNSELMKLFGKELVARQFIEDVRKDKAKIKLDQTSEKKIKEIFAWLYEKFNIK